jgi:hypothetical protein
MTKESIQFIITQEGKKFWKCPNCNKKHSMSDEQFLGTKSVICDCDYSEQKNYSSLLPKQWNKWEENRLAELKKQNSHG